MDSSAKIKEQLVDIQVLVCACVHQAMAVSTVKYE